MLSCQKPFQLTDKNKKEMEQITREVQSSGSDSYAVVAMCGISG